MMIVREVFRAALLLVLACCADGNDDSKDGELRIASPVPGQQVSAGSDLIVKYSLANSQGEAAENNPEHATSFSVVPARSWEELDAQVAMPGTGGACKPRDPEKETTFPPEDDADGGCPFTGGCLHEVWVGGGGEIPEKFHAYMDSWLELSIPHTGTLLHPEWQFIIWTDDKITWPLRNKALMHQADSYAELSDLVRLEVIERFGGVYIDTDFEALRAIDDLVAGLDFFVGTEKNAETVVWGRPGEDREVWVCPSIFGATPHNAAVRALLDGLPRQVAENLGTDPNQKSGPYYWSSVYDSTRACAAADVESCAAVAGAGAGEAGGLDPREHAAHVLHAEVAAGRAKVFPREVFYPYGWWEQQKAAARDFGDAYAVHHWQKNWGGGWKQNG